MRTEVRFLLAVGLMFVVLIGTNFLFPPIVPEPDTAADSAALAGADSGAVGDGQDVQAGGAASDDDATAPGAAPALPQSVTAGAGTDAGNLGGASAAAGQESRVVVEGPLYRYEFSNLGARMVAAELSGFQNLLHGGVVDLVPQGSEGLFDQRLVVGQDTVDLSRVPYRVEPADGLQLSEGGAGGTLRFVYEHPTEPFAFEVAYTFSADLYIVGVEGSVTGVDRPLLLTGMGEGIAYAEVDSTAETRMMAYVYNEAQGGIQATTLDNAEVGVVGGPLVWAAFKSKFFVTALLGGQSEEIVAETDYLGGLVVRESSLPGRVHMSVAQSVGNDGRFAYRLFVGPQVYDRLSSLGQDMEEVNPYGWRFFRPIVRPIVGVIMTVLTFLHTNLSIGYGWVLIVFGVSMRIVLFPLNHKAMKAQLRNMAVQPLVQEIQKRYKDDPQKLQKEMMRLYKEHGFNPLAGCLPMLLPWPVLIALFFVFQNTIELRGVPFLWLPDLSAKDPLYILPVMLAVSMFLMQFVSLRSLDQTNPQMKMMMYVMPPMMLFIFLNFASGLNLYYATANIATIPQQIWIANERKKLRGKPPPKLDDD